MQSVKLGLEGAIHEETQVHEARVDLTAARIWRPAGRGELDFGGSEYRAAPVEEIPAEKRHPGDDYGWWTLDSGVYRVGFNERLTAGRAVLQSLPRLLDAGAFVPARMAEAGGEITALLVVGDSGLAVKENARLAGLYTPP
ncbi:MAG: dCTP deaminase [Thermoplasmatota archaeon]